MRVRLYVFLCTSCVFCVSYLKEEPLKTPVESSKIVVAKIEEFEKSLKKPFCCGGVLPGVKVIIQYPVLK